MSDSSPDTCPICGIEARVEDDQFNRWVICGVHYYARYDIFSYRLLAERLVYKSVRGQIDRQRKSIVLRELNSNHLITLKRVLRTDRVWQMMIDIEEGKLSSLL